MATIHWPTPIREPVMKPKRLDMLLAFKAISLSISLSGSEKRILATILDHFNHKTGQCDPSLSGIAELLSVDRRTVMRAIKRAEQIGLLRKIRHGGKYHRNLYVPPWTQYGLLENSWRHKKREHSLRHTRNFLSPLGRQTRHVDGGKPASQTCLINNSNETWEDGQPNKENLRPPTLTNITRQHSQGLASMVHVKHASSQPVARDAAQRRWDNAILTRFAGSAFFSKVVDAIDLTLSEAATKIEMESPGKGSWYVIKQLVERGVVPRTYLDDEIVAGDKR